MLVVNELPKVLSPYIVYVREKGNLSTSCSQGEYNPRNPVLTPLYKIVAQYQKSLTE